MKAVPENNIAFIAPRKGIPTAPGPAGVQPEQRWRHSDKQVGIKQMANPADLQSFTLAGITHRCTQETERFFQHLSYDPRYCFELFRRAIVGHSQLAWASVYNQYRPLVAGWVERHSAFASCGEEVQYFINRAFEKMWNSLTPDKFRRFPDLKSLLRYLQMCVHSVILDEARKAECTTVAMEDEMLLRRSAIDAGDEENDPVDRIHRQQLWAEIQARLQDEQERKVMYGSFVLGLPPRELVAHFDDTFGDVREVYRVKENVLARLRRDAELLSFLGGDA
jgi:DNA-directed RNA polymerase specialized sigma24 family protein